MNSFSSISSTLIISITLCSVSAFSQDITFNDDNSKLIHPVNDEHLAQIYTVNGDDNSKSDLLSMFNYITPVKSQGARNVCTVFSFTALLEAMYLKKYTAEKDVDLSEQWVQYLASLRNASGGAKGSTVPTNFKGVKSHGIADEDASPYRMAEWRRDGPEAKKVCKGLSDLNLTRCIFGQMHPGALKTNDARLIEKGFKDFVTARNSAEQNKADFINGMRGGVVSSVRSIKQKLRNNTPLTLEINVYYGSWNYAKWANNLGAYHKASEYNKGIVNYPEKGSIDRARSRDKKNAARHSVLIVGYDDNIVLTYKKNMADGTVKTFSRKGVYYIKNSWGHKFGRRFKYGRSTYPGIGMISQDYAEEYGQFYGVELATSI